MKMSKHKFNKKKRKKSITLSQSFNKDFIFLEKETKKKQHDLVSFSI